MLEAMRTLFYEIFGPQHDEAKKSGSILNKDKYDEIVDALRKYKTVKKDQFMKNWWNKYALMTNVEDNLFQTVSKNDEQNLKNVVWYEWIFDAIYEMSVSLVHSLYSRTHKILIDKTLYGLPETVIKLYIKLCSECPRATKAPISETTNLL